MKNKEKWFAICSIPVVLVMIGVCIFISWQKNLPRHRFIQMAEKVCNAKRIDSTFNYQTIDVNKAGETERSGHYYLVLKPDGDVSDADKTEVLLYDDEIRETLLSEFKDVETAKRNFEVGDLYFGRYDDMQKRYEFNDSNHKILVGYEGTEPTMLVGYVVLQGKNITSYKFEIPVWKITDEWKEQIQKECAALALQDPFELMEKAQVVTK